MDQQCDMGFIFSAWEEAVINICMNHIHTGGLCVRNSSNLSTSEAFHSGSHSLDSCPTPSVSYLSLSSGSTLRMWWNKMFRNSSGSAGQEVELWYGQCDCRGLRQHWWLWMEAVCITENHWLKKKKKKKKLNKKKKKEKAGGQQVKEAVTNLFTF